MYTHSRTSSIKRARLTGSDKRANKGVLSTIAAKTKTLCLCGVVAGQLFTVAFKDSDSQVNKRFRNRSEPGLSVNSAWHRAKAVYEKPADHVATPSTVSAGTGIAAYVISRRLAGAPHRSRCRR